VIDLCPIAGRTVAERYGAPWTPSLGELRGVHAVVLAVPTEAHYPLAASVLEQGVPLLVEKPLAPSLDQSRQIVSLAEQNSVPLMCGLQERYNPAVLTMLSMLDRPVHVTAARHAPYAPRIRTGVAWDLLIHDVDLTLRVFGAPEPERMQGSFGYFHPASQTGEEDVADAILSFPGGELSVLSASRIGQHKVRSLRVSEVDRLIEADLLHQTVTVYRHVPSRTTHRDGYHQHWQPVLNTVPLSSSAEPLAIQFDRFLGLVTDKAEPDEERRSILPAHRVVHQLRAQAAQELSPVSDNRQTMLRRAP
jgi:predicted dehydrogenase